MGSLVRVQPGPPFFQEEKISPIGPKSPIKPYKANKSHNKIKREFAQKCKFISPLFDIHMEKNNFLIV